MVATCGALLEVRGLRREFPTGESPITVLDGIDLRIEAGEMVAIVGASGSGKSTLMNILGALDRPTSGSYRVAEQEVADLDADGLARLRREHFGFVFQRYQLLGELTAQDNVALPAIYAGCSAQERQARARLLLERLGLGTRADHRPSQLSGGQQQRVSIARALMNGGSVILADEPTGALDTASGEEVLRLLSELNAQGHTVIIVTHDAQVARRASRVIEISDGRIVSDSRSEAAAVPAAAALPPPEAAAHRADAAISARWAQSLRMALFALHAHRLRALLTMLGIVIGIAALVCVVALGKGAQAQVMTQIRELGTNTLEIFPGRDFGDMKASSVESLSVEDAEALAQHFYVDSASPNISVSVAALRGPAAASAQVNGVGAALFRVRGMALAEGRFFDIPEQETRAQVAVIDQRAARALFGYASPIGQTVLLGEMPVQVVGVLRPMQSSFASSTPGFFVPYTTVATRLAGRQYLESITLRIKDDISSRAAQGAVHATLRDRHGSQDFFILNSDQIRQAAMRTSRTLSLLISGVATLSLMVGGIGVMNIMLVSVTERTREIGVRMAVGARRSDIVLQFLMEAVLICLMGGAAGVVLAYGLGTLLAVFLPQLPMAFSSASVVLAVASSCLIGMAFGYLPARNAARLEPVQALARD